ncbi:hypothetical protein A3D01_05050 [Candidatus Woesebacteria bacterium RIFCSPHIGHO2_02_FULL_39_13]|uniref:ArnT-like N-terminal domain-containing protein n=1 Tax=Candidatus Woesebacteria bacterium RIFCSPHIGHO2_02_FULL_39_13 TaxID=1802505 RepID=A0A1F7Z0D5_9BACT|nr:MAG: hypothetical protein A3D01_05050 [Candidatus Woesebacteria bacterium RIFCSPHIGHO2_02_FULL_39_13]OGM74427.1 MAG: hypothetical protein A3H19_05360 [Candidatus Woesebacteria bacterium RIFCSPLOWO2_12_FULL_39_9]
MYKNIFSQRNLIIIILLVAAFLRLWKLGTIPPHLTSDEAALGYNAYSILKTGKDEYGKIFPIVFKSFGDYKTGFYIYLTVPTVAVFGLNEFSVRLPSALLGVLAVLLIYLIVKEFKVERNLEILAPALLAINPWHIHFSRGAWETNASLTLTLLGIYFFLKSLKSAKFIILSSFFFSLTILTYQGSKLATTIVVLILIIVFRKEVRDLFTLKKREILVSLSVGLIICLPIIASLFQGRVGRLGIYSIFSYPRKESSLQVFLDQGKEKVGGINYYIFHSESLNFTRAILGRWFNHFSGRFLFFEGDWQNPRHSSPNQGMMLLFDLVLLLAGSVALTRYRSRLVKFTILWLIAAPLPAALSRDQVHAVRALNMVIPLILISSLGLTFLLGKINKFSIWSKRFSYAFIISGLLLSLIYYLESYFVHLSKHESDLWNYGYRQIVESVTPLENKYENIKIQQSFAQPYIYFLFYQKYDPEKYQRQAKLTESEYKGDVGYIEHLDNICFCAIDWPQNKKEHGTLVVADKIRIPDVELSGESVNLIKEIKFLNGDVAFRIVEVK